MKMKDLIMLSLVEMKIKKELIMPSLVEMKIKKEKNDRFFFLGKK